MSTIAILKVCLALYFSTSKGYVTTRNYKNWSQVVTLVNLCRPCAAYSENGRKEHQRDLKPRDVACVVHSDPDPQETFDLLIWIRNE
jgi:hypothetical protein